MNTKPMNTLRIDTEFRGSNNPHVTPVCAVVKIAGAEFRYFFPQDKDRFIVDWRKMMAKPLAIISYYCSAETRFLSACGFTPTEILSWTWLDPYVLWRMLTHSHPAYKYGDRVKILPDGTHTWVTTTKPVAEEEWTENEEGDLVAPDSDEDHGALSKGLDSAAAALLHVDMDKPHKQAMRDLIMFNATYTEEEQQQILEYCAEDVKYLLPIFSRLYKDVHRLTNGECDIAQVQRLSRYVVCCGLMEDNGIPIYVEAAENLGRNYTVLDSELVEGVNKMYPFYTSRKSTRSELLKNGTEHRWVESQKAFEQYIERVGLLDSWPRSKKSGKCKKDKDTLKTYSADPTIDRLRTVKKSRNQIKYFRPSGWGEMRKHIGSDNHIRPLLSPFGSKTGRNQPSVKAGYLFGMSTWLRPLICSTDPDVCVVGADFSAQEIALQGWVSGDDKFLNAYRSGDPYTWFAQFTRVLPSTVCRKKGKFWDTETDTLVPPELQHTYKGIRNTFKALLLGVGFGMGLDKLATSLTVSRIQNLSEEDAAIVRQSMTTKDPVIVEQAEQILRNIRVVSGKLDSHNTQYPAQNRATTYRNFHKSTFQKYWTWRERITSRYARDGYLRLEDGWCLFTGEDSPNTVANFPVQGTGACILRKAVENCILAGLRVFAPLHDCIYINTSKAALKEDEKTLRKCLQAAVASICGEDLIRIDLKEYTTDWNNYTSTFTEEKQAAEFAQFGKYMVPKKDFGTGMFDDAGGLIPNATPYTGPAIVAPVLITTIDDEVDVSGFLADLDL